ncbi:MAG: VWA domain-containing protein [Rikenellaceae bacterium]|nr:VWA domain-containing protein [Rikenellaceae bacterium]MBQ8745013.1 VWA domain-containing protein [Rikenellaceae bacterium]MBR2501185.1 VWA domain-containing protein [Rikenellaceae bacterium]MBR4056236.1 VWA domain-containing protein [Rikenellaceae bacterium]
MFRFANPYILYLLLIIPAAIVLFIFAQMRRRRRLERFASSSLLAQLTPSASPARLRTKFVLYSLALAFLILAAARPQVGSKLREEHQKGIEMMLVVDVSNSMLAEDFEPNRLDRTKFAIDRVVESMKQDRIGVVAFAGEAQVQLPITSDYRMARAFARKLSPQMVRTQGTDLGAAIKLATMSFSSQSEGSRVMILITDGENHESDALEAAQAAAEKGIAIYTIGIGTPEGAPVMIGGEYLTDENGDMVVSKLDEKMLQEIASTTGGAYVRATKQSIGLKEIVDRLKELDESDLATTRFEAFDEQFQYPLVVALLLLLIEWLILDRRNPLLARFNIFGRQEE